MADALLGPSGGNGGHEFANYAVPAGARVREIRLTAGFYVDSLQIVYSDGSGAVVEMDKVGGRGFGGSSRSFVLNEDEYLTGVSGRYGHYIDSIRFHTNLRTSDTFGGSGGHEAYQYEAAPGSEIVGFFGRADWYIDKLGVIVRPRAESADSAAAAASAAAAPKTAAAPKAPAKTKATKAATAEETATLETPIVPAAAVAGAAAAKGRKRTATVDTAAETAAAETAAAETPAASPAVATAPAAKKTRAAKAAPGQPEIAPPTSPATDTTAPVTGQPDVVAPTRLDPAVESPVDALPAVVPPAAARATRKKAAEAPRPGGTNLAVPAAQPVAQPTGAQPDDLTKIEGIGPKIAQLLNDAGITSFRELADADVERLRGILSAAGSRYRMADPATWPQQAELAARGAWDEFDALVARLKAGRNV